jgi:hypothetical protein
MVSKFHVAGNGAHGLMFQKLWALLLLSFYPPSTATICSSIVLNKSCEIFPLFSYVSRNVDSHYSNLLHYDVEMDDEETFEVEGAESELNSSALKVRIYR